MLVRYSPIENQNNRPCYVDIIRSERWVHISILKPKTHFYITTQKETNATMDRHDTYCATMSIHLDCYAFDEWDPTMWCMCGSKLCPYNVPRYNRHIVPEPNLVDSSGIAGNTEAFVAGQSRISNPFYMHSLWLLRLPLDYTHVTCIGPPLLSTKLSDRDVGTAYGASRIAIIKAYKRWHHAGGQLMAQKYGLPRPLSPPSKAKVSKI